MDTVVHVAVIALVASLVWAVLAGHRLQTQRTLVPGDIHWSVAALAVNLLKGVVLAGLGEELFRLGLARRLDAWSGRPVTGLPSRWSLTAATAVWTLPHPQYQPAYLIVVFLTGMVLVRAYERSGSLWTAIAAHAAINATVSVSAFLLGR